MYALLSPRVWVALALCAVMGFTHFTAYRWGKGVVKREWDADIAKRTAVALKAEQEAREREKQLVAAKQHVEEKYAHDKRKADNAAAGARNELGRLRDQLATPGRATSADSSTCTGVDAGARLERDLLGACATTLVGVAQEADRLGTQLTGLQQYVSNVCLKR